MKLAQNSSDMKERPIIIKLNQQCAVESLGDYGREPSTVYEPIYVAASHIEYFFWMGVTRLRMVSGETISIRETPEEIMALIVDMSSRLGATTGNAST